MACPGVAPAQDPSHRGIIGDDDRVIVTETGSPWVPIGQVDTTECR